MQEYKRKLLKIFIPIMISNLISQVQMLIDRIFLSRLDVIYMSAVGNATAPVWTTMSFVFSLSMGASILISHAVGENNRDKITTYSASLVKFSNIIPFFLFLFWEFFCPFVYRIMGVSENVMGYCITYTRLFAPTFLFLGIGSSCTVILQTSNYTKPLIHYGIIRSLLNVILDWALIYGNLGCPAMGIAGAALATTIAEIIGGLVFVIIVIKKKNLISKPDFSSIIKAPARPFYNSAKLGINTAAEDFLWNFGNLAILRILNSINDQAAGIWNIILTVEILAVVIIGAIGGGAMTVSGEATGSQDFRIFRKSIGTSYSWSAIVSGVTLVLAILFPRQILEIFTSDQGIISSSTVFLMLIALNLFSKSGNIIVGNGIRGFGDTRWMMCTQIFGTVFTVCSAMFFVYTLKLGILGVFIAVLMDEALRFIINSIRFFRIRF